MLASTYWEVEAGSMPTRGSALSMSTQGSGEGVVLVRSVKCWALRSWLGADTGLLRAGLHSVQQIQRNPNGEGAPP